MQDFNPYFTNDGSVGLYSEDFDDVFHSAYGALTEAYEKFILPANFKKYFQKNNEIKILDLCFGIGYNTKSFLNYLIDNLNIDAIDTNNVTCNDKIYTDNTELNFLQNKGTNKIDGEKFSLQKSNKIKIYIHAIEKDKILVQLSPFIKNWNEKFYTKFLNFINNNLSSRRSESRIAESLLERLHNKYAMTESNYLPFEHEKISKMLSEKIKPKYKLNPQINYLLLEKLKNIIDEDVYKILYDKKYAQYFDHAVINFNNDKNSYNHNLYPLYVINKFLHNIYYRYISTCNKKALKALKLTDINFKVSPDDARVVLKNDKSKYNFVFLDAFTPTKCPCLWSLEFLKLLYEHLEDRGMILTYSSSALVRHAMLDAGFMIYKNIIDGKSQGTIAVKITCPPLEGGPKSLISRWGNFSELSQYDLGLLNTKAGIYYRDKNLNLTNEEIIANHDIEVKNSTLMSATKYKKQNLL